MPDLAALVRIRRELAAATADLDRAIKGTDSTTRDAELLRDACDVVEQIVPLLRQAADDEQIGRSS